LVDDEIDDMLLLEVFELLILEVEVDEVLIQYPLTDETDEVE